MGGRREGGEFGVCSILLHFRTLGKKVERERSGVLESGLINRTKVAMFIAIILFEFPSTTRVKLKIWKD